MTGPNDRARAALDAAAQFWDALAADDDRALVAILAPTALALQGGGPDHPGLCAAFRDGWGVDASAISSLGWLDTFGILAEGGFRIRRTLKPGGVAEAGVPLETWPVDVIPNERGAWVIDPIRPFARAEIGTLTVDLRHR